MPTNVKPVGAEPVVDEDVLNEQAVEPTPQQAVDDSLDATASDYENKYPPPPEAPVTHKPAQTQTARNEAAAKRKLVLSALRNSERGRKEFAQHIRRMYRLSPKSKLTDEEVIQSAYDVQAEAEPDLAPDTFEKDLHTAFGDKVDKSLLTQAREDYPGLADDNALIEKMYRARLKKIEVGPLSYEDKAQIVARRFPKLHETGLEPDEALKAQYKLVKAKGRDIGSYDDWIHSLMAPTLFEQTMGMGGAIAKGLVAQAKDVGTLVTEVAVPGRAGADINAAMQGDVDAQERLKAAGKGAVTAGSFAAGPLVKGGLTALEGAMGVAKTAPLLAGALEGAAIGGAQSGGTSAVEGKPLGEVLQDTASGAGVGAGLGSIAGAVGGHVQKVQAAKTAAQEAAELAAAKAAGSADLPTPAPVAPAAPPVTNPLALAARAQGEHRWGTAIVQFAEKHGMDVEDVHKLVDGPEPATADLAAANMRNGVSIDDINALKEFKPEHMVPEPATAAPIEPPVAAPAPAAPVAPIAPAAPEGPPPSRGVVQGGVSERMTEALKRAEAQLGERKSMIREQRSARLAAARAAFEAAGSGMPGLRAKLSTMAGEMKKPDWEGVQDLFGDIDRGQLHTAIAQSAMLEGDKLSAHAGLERLLQGSGAGAPTASQIRALRLAFGDDFAEAAVKLKPEMSSWLKLVSKTLNTPRTIMTSFDLSAPMRQGYLMSSQPGFWKAWNTMVKSVGDQKFATEAAQTIKDDPLYDVMRESGVFFQGPEFKAASETFAGSWADNAPGVKHSQRAYDSFINQTRANVFRDFYGTVQKNGGQVTDPAFRRSLAHWVNTGSGRGNLALLGRDANLLNSIAFSPRLAWSRFETFNPMYYASLHPTVRSAALKANIGTIAATTGLLGMIAGSGAGTVNWDPRTSDFGKLRVGNTRIDMFGGHQQLARMMAQITTGKVISSTTGQEVDLSGSDEKNGFRRGTMNRADVIARFLEAKAAPIASLALATLRGKDFLGRPISMPNEIATRLTPMIFEDLADALKDGGAGRVATVAPLATIGIGAQTYGAKLPKSAGGKQEPDEGVAMTAGRWLWNRANGIETDPSELAGLDAKLAEQWVKDAAIAQVMAHHEATQKNGFFDKGFDQQGEIRKATARRMARVSKLYKDLTGANGEAARLRANEDLLKRRVEATGADSAALENPALMEGTK